MELSLSLLSSQSKGRTHQLKLKPTREKKQNGSQLNLQPSVGEGKSWKERRNFNQKNAVQFNEWFKNNNKKQNKANWVQKKTYQSTAQMPVMILWTNDVQIFLHLHAFLHADSGIGSCPNALFTNRKKTADPAVVKITEFNSMVYWLLWKSWCSMFLTLWNPNIPKTMKDEYPKERPRKTFYLRNSFRRII